VAVVVVVEVSEAVATRIAEKGKETSFRNAQMREMGRAQIQIAQCITKTGVLPDKTA
jgi:hypothetical protein